MGRVCPDLAPSTERSGRGTLDQKAAFRSGRHISTSTISPDETIVVNSSLDSNGHGYLYDLTLGKSLPPLIHEGQVNEPVFSPDGRVLAIKTNENNLYVWDFKGRRLLFPPIVQAGLIVSTAFSSDSALIATGGYDPRVSIWNTKDGPLVASFTHQAHKINCVRFSPDNKTLAASGDEGDVFLWRFADKGRPPLRMKHQFSAY